MFLYTQAWIGMGNTQPEEKEVPKTKEQNRNSDISSRMTVAFGMSSSYIKCVKATPTGYDAINKARLRKSYKYRYYIIYPISYMGVKITYSLG